MTHSTYTLLMIEDFSADREQYRRYLLADSSCTYCFLEAESVEEGLELCRTRAIDAVLLDYLLPDADGLAFLESLYAQSKGSSPPVVMVTGEGHERIAVQAIKLGAEDYLVKRDLTPKLLQLTISSAIKNARLQLQLQESEERFRNLADNMSQFAWMADASGWLFWYNRRWFEYTGTTLEEMQGWGWQKVHHPEHLDRVVERFRHSLETGEEWEDMFPLRGQDGTYRWFLSRAIPIADEAGKVLRWFGTNTDITDLKHAEQRLRESEERLRAGVEVGDVGLAKFDYATNMVELSPEAAALYGFPAKELIVSREQIHATFHPDERTEILRLIEQVLNPQGTGWFARDHRVVRQNGEVRWLSVRKQVFFDRSGEIARPSYGILAAIDITERKQTQAALEERNQELNSFVHIVSHDLKAPLRAISNLSQWIEEDLKGTLSADSQEHMTLLRSRVHRMDAMIDGLLDYARVGRTDAMMEPVMVEELLDEVIDSMAPPPNFKITIDPNLPTLYTKRLRLSQVFANLIGNAIKHHGRTDGSIHISGQDQGDFYEFAVADDGPGIAPECHDKIFMIFQVGKSQNSQDSSGIGLSIVKRIVETEKGTIRLESQLEKGTTFYFTWPKNHKSTGRLKLP
jgi:PAS domain S-box-containing protein